VAHAWLVDPIARTLEVLTARAGAFGAVESYRKSERVRAEPFAAVEIDLSELWAR
jgi:hypothetical protein